MAGILYAPRMETGLGEFRVPKLCRLPRLTLRSLGRVEDEGEQSLFLGEKWSVWTTPDLRCATRGMISF